MSRSLLLLLTLDGQTVRGGRRLAVEQAVLEVLHGHGTLEAGRSRLDVKLSLELLGQSVITRLAGRLLLLLCAFQEHLDDRVEFCRLRVATGSGVSARTRRLELGVVEVALRLD